MELSAGEVQGCQPNVRREELPYLLSVVGWCQSGFVKTSKASRKARSLQIYGVGT